MVVNMCLALLTYRGVLIRGSVLFTQGLPRVSQFIVFLRQTGDTGRIQMQSKLHRPQSAIKCKHIVRSEGGVMWRYKGLDRKPSGRQMTDGSTAPSEVKHASSTTGRVAVISFDYRKCFLWVMDQRCVCSSLGSHMI